MKSFLVVAALSALTGVKAQSNSTVSFCTDCPTPTPVDDIVTRSDEPVADCTAPTFSVLPIGGGAITTTSVYTITACPETVTNCPIGSVTSEIVTLPTGGAEITLTSTNIYTITACPETVTNCPIGSVTSEIVTMTTAGPGSPGSPGYPSVPGNSGVPSGAPGVTGAPGAPGVTGVPGVPAPGNTEVPGVPGAPGAPGNTELPVPPPSTMATGVDPGTNGTLPTGAPAPVPASANKVLGSITAAFGLVIAAYLI